MDDRLWLSPPEKLILLNNEIHIWRACLDLSMSHLHSLQRTLSLDELERADRFHFKKDRFRFIATRGILRAILGVYLATEPSQLRFCYGDYGKPALVSASGQESFNFNLSHSDRLVLYAITRGLEVGIDLERIRDDLEYEQIAEQYFSPQEYAVLRTFPAKMKLRVFFNYWVRKEAYIKARGEGLSLPLNRFNVSLVPNGTVELLYTRGDSQDFNCCSLMELSPGHNFVAALAVIGCAQRLSYWQW